MSLVTIKNYIQSSLPSGNEIPMTVLVAVLLAMVDDNYEVGQDGGLIFTQELLTKLNGIAVGAQVNETSHPISFITGLQGILDGKVNTAFVNAAVAAVVDNAPEGLNTLAELAAAINNDPDFYNTMLGLIASININNGKKQKLVDADYTITSLDDEYDIVFNSAIDITITVEDVLIDSFNCNFFNNAAGAANFVAAVGTNLNSPDGVGMSLTQNKVGAMFKIMNLNDHVLKGEFI